MSDEISVERLGQFATDIATLRHQIEQAKAREPDLVNPRIRPEIGTADMEPILDEILRLRAEVERLTAERDTMLRVRLTEILGDYGACQNQSPLTPGDDTTCRSLMPRTRFPVLGRDEWCWWCEVQAALEGDYAEEAGDE